MSPAHPRRHVEDLDVLDVVDERIVWPVAEFRIAVDADRGPALQVRRDRQARNAELRDDVGVPVLAKVFTPLVEDAAARLGDQVA